MKSSDEIEKLVSQACDYADSEQFERAEALTLLVLKEEPENAGALYLRVFCLRRSGRVDEAEKAAIDALKLLPDNVLLLVERAWINFDQKEYDQAIRFFDQALQREPEDVDTLKGKITSLRRLRRFELAQQAADSALKLAPENVLLLLERAWIEYDQGEYEKAIEFFDQALRREPTNADALKWKITSLRRLRRFELAQQAADSALKLAPENVLLLLERAWIEYDQGENEKAIEFFDEALRREPTNADALKWKITSLRRLRRFELAQQAADSALKLAPENVLLLLERAWIEYDQGEYEKAIEFFDQALRREPTNADALKWKITSLRRLRRFELAQQAADSALKLAPENVLLLLERAWIEYDQGENEKAIEFFDQALRREPTNADALKWKITSLRRLRRFELAQQAADSALKLAPENVLLLLERAWIEYDQGENEKAIEFFDQALRREQTNADALKWKISSLRRLRRFELAQQAADDALKLAPENALLLLERAWIEYDQGEYEKAIEFFDQALRREPTNADALKWKITSLRLLRRFQLAQQAADDALKLAPDNVLLLLERAWLEYDQDDYEKAIGFFDQVLQREAAHVDALKGKISTLRFLLRFEAALKAVDDALKLAPDNVLLLLERAWIEYDQDDYEKAIGFFDQVLQREPAHVDALKGKISSLRFLLRFEAALKTANDALKLAPVSGSLMAERAWIDYDQNNYEKAIGFFDQALQCDPKNIDALKWKIASLRRLRRFDEATRVADYATNLLPSKASLFVERAFIEYDQGKYDQAIGFLNQAIAADSRNEEAIKWKSIALGAQQKTDDGIKFLEGLLLQFPRSMSLRVQLGWLYLDQDSFDSAECMFSEAAALSPPHNSSPLLGRAETLVRQNRSDEAVLVLRSGLETLPNDLEVHNTLGWLYIDRNDPLNARKEFEIMLAQSAKSAAALNGLGGIAFSQEDYEKAQDHFRQAGELEPSEHTWLSNLAWSLVRQDQGEAQSARGGWIPSGLKSDQARMGPLAEAEECCQKALKLQPNYANAFGCLGVIAFKGGRLRESEEYFQRSIRANKRAGSYVDLAALYITMGRYDEAEAHLNTALRFDPNDVSAHIERGNLLLQKENAKEAIREFRQAMGLDPNSESAQRAHAVALIYSGSLDEAEKHLRNAIRRMDQAKRWSLHLTLGQLLEKRGDETQDRRYYEEALAEINKAIVLRPDEPEPHFQAGMVRSKCDETSGAMRSFARCLQLNKNHFIAERNLDRIRSQRREEKERVRKLGTVGGVFLGVISLSLLVMLWLNFFGPHLLAAGVKVSDTMLITLTPILLGLIVVGLMLPALIRLKLPGVEAELSQPKLKEVLAVGPKGTTDFSSSPPNVSAGPR